MKTNWKKNIAIFMSAQSISFFGTALVQYAITWHITLQSGSGAHLTLAVICGFVPTFVLSPFAGVWADRYNRKTLVMISDGCIAIATLILIFVVRSGNHTLTPLFIALIIRSLGTAVQMPCATAILPAIVPEKHLTKVNGINGSLQSVITVFSPMLAAVLYKTMPFYQIFMIDIVTAVIGIAITFFAFKYEQRPYELEKKNDYMGELKLGIKYIVNRQYLKYFFLATTAIHFLCAPVGFLTPLQVTRNFGEDAIYLMMLEVGFSLGMIVGGIIIAVWGGFKNRMKTAIFGGTISAVLIIVLGIKMPIVPYVIALFICGMSLPIYSTPAVVMLQERVDEEYQGRVFSVQTMVTTSAMPLGMLVFGPLGDIVAIEYILIGSGILMFLIGGYFLNKKPLVEAGWPLERV